MANFRFSNILKSAVIIGAFSFSVFQYQYFKKRDIQIREDALLTLFKTDLQFEVNVRLKEHKKLTLACMTQSNSDVSDALLSLTEMMHTAPLTTFHLVRCFDETLADALLSEEPYASMQDEVLAQVIDPEPLE